MVLDCYGKDSLGLYRAVDLIYEDVDGTLVLADHSNLVGSETNWAQQKRNQKLNAAGKAALPPSDEVESEVEIFHPENREKILDIRDTDIRDEEQEIEGEDIAVPQAVTISHPSHLLPLSILLYLLSNLLISILYRHIYGHVTVHIVSTWLFGEETLSSIKIFIFNLLISIIYTLYLYYLWGHFGGQKGDKGVDNVPTLVHTDNGTYSLKSPR